MGICENKDVCGGCFYQGVDYEEQLAIKENDIKELLKESAEGDYEFESIIPSPLKEHYRNKMEFTFGDQVKDGDLCLGMHQKRSFYNIINADNCMLPHEDAGKIVKATREYFNDLGIKHYHKRRHKGYLRHLLYRRAVNRDGILIDLVTSGDVDFDEKKVLEGWKDLMLSLDLKGEYKGILHTRNNSLADAVKDEGTEVLFGDAYFYEEILGLKFKISPFSFFQTNTLGAEKLYSKVREYVGSDFDEKPSVYDLYCGTGTITQLMAKVSEHVYGVEIVKEAVLAARENAELNEISNVSFIAGDVLKTINDDGALIKEDGTLMDAKKPDIIILDPPRDGVHPRALRKIIDYGVKRLVYVSCKPKSFMRDLGPLQYAGYKLIKACPVDMFPLTNNCELVALLEKE